MSRFLNFTKGDNIAKVTVVDRILELIALVLFLVMVVLSVLFYMNAPEIIPTHFDASGTPNGWGAKFFYFYTLAVGVLVMGLSSASAYHHKMINLPITLNPKCLPLQLTLLGRLARVMTVLLGVMFIFITLSMAAPQMHLNPTLFSIGVFVTVVALFGVIIFYTIRIQRVGNCYR